MAKLVNVAILLGAESGIASIAFKAADSQVSGGHMSPQIVN